MQFLAVVISQTPKPQLAELRAFIVPGSVAFVFLAFILTVICICMCVCRKVKSKGKRPSKTPPVELNVLLRPPVNNVTTRLKDFPKSSVRLLQELADGHYGKLYRAELLGYHGNGTVTRTIVKALHDNAPSEVRQQFEHDLERIADLRHPNVMSVLGVCKGSDVTRAPLALYEYVAHGDLRQFLLVHSPHCELNSEDALSEACILSQSDMLHISVQLASALDYLCSHGQVSSDIAARNILVGDGMVVKLTDLGLGRCLYPADYYCRPGQPALPVRWMAPETLFHGQLTAESNIWSFGVLLWEVFTYGLQPYYGYANHEVVDMIGAHQILPCPDHASSSIYALMIDMWHEIPNQRPSFAQIHATLQQLRTCSLLLVPPPAQASGIDSIHPSPCTNTTDLTTPYYKQGTLQSQETYQPLHNSHQLLALQDSHVSSSGATSCASMSSHSELRNGHVPRKSNGHTTNYKVVASSNDGRITDV